MACCLHVYRPVQAIHIRARRSSTSRVEKARSSGIPLYKYEALHAYRAYSQTLKHQPNNRIKLRPAHLRHTIQPQTKHQHPFLLRPLHKDRAPNRRRQRLTDNFLVTLRAAQHRRGGEMCHGQQLVGRVMVVEHAWVHRIR